jgi:prepilin-type N-terminal cleavage/methylation domain-containing protein
MNNRKGFTLIEILLALGIMSIATVFLSNGIYNIEQLSKENQEVAIMGRVLQSNMEILLAEKEHISSKSYYFEDYLVEVNPVPYQNSSLYTLHLIVTNPSGKSISGGIIYESNYE